MGLVVTGNGNGKKAIIIPVTIAIFQAILVLFQWGIWTEMRDHEARLRLLEAFMARGDRWTATDHYAFERGLEKQFARIREDLVEIKVRLGIKVDEHDKE